MANWKQNKIVGIVAAIVVILVVVGIAKMLAGRGGTVSEKDKTDIEKIEKLVNMQMERDVRGPGGR